MSVLRLMLSELPWQEAIYRRTVRVYQDHSVSGWKVVKRVLWIFTALEGPRGEHVPTTQVHLHRALILPTVFVIVGSQVNQGVCVPCAHPTRSVAAEV
jgi:hypothetical protein